MQSEKRIEIVDILRGWALLLVVISNYLFFGYGPEGKTNGNKVISETINIIESIFISAKGWTLLFVIFGFGFGVIYDRLKQKTYSFFIRRMLVLFLFAFINSLFYDGDILRDYAFLGLLFLFFIHLSPKKLIIIGSVMLIFAPILTLKINSLDSSYLETLAEGISIYKYSGNILEVFKYNFLNSYYFEVLNLSYSITAHFIMFICMLFGLAIYKSHFLENMVEKKKIIEKIVIISFILVFVLWLIFVVSNFLNLIILKYFSLYYWIILCTMIFTSSVIMLLFVNNKLKNIFKAFSLIGKMTFTNYLVQNLIAFFVFQGVGLGLFHHQPFYFYLLLALGVYILQIFFSKWWLKSNYYGPVEWLWRQISFTFR